MRGRFQAPVREPDRWIGLREGVWPPDGRATLSRMNAFERVRRGEMAEGKG